MATLVSIDTSTLLWENLEYARLQVRVKNQSYIRLEKKLWINEQIWNILIEEEPPACHEGRHTQSWYGDSSDSVSSSKTFIEETIFSSKSCEEEARSGSKEELRSEGEEDGGKAVEEGEEGAHKTNLFFKIIADKDSPDQSIDCISCMKEDRIGQVACRGADLDVNPDQGRSPICNSYSTHAELAKVVVELESFNSQGTPALYVGQGRKVEAQCLVAHIPCETQIGKKDVGLCTLQEAPRSENANENIKSMSCRGGKQEEKREEVQTGEREVSGLGNQGMEIESPLKERVDECHTEEFDEALKGVMVGGLKPIAFGEEGAAAGSNLMLSPRWRMIEGLSEVGASTSNPRRSVRINARITKAGASSNHRHGMSSVSISDGDFVNCNTRNCDPPKLWEIGKQAGLYCTKDEDEVVKEYMCLEERDLVFLQSYEEGKQKDQSC